LQAPVPTLFVVESLMKFHYLFFLSTFRFPTFLGDDIAFVNAFLRCKLQARFCFHNLSLLPLKRSDHSPSFAHIALGYPRIAHIDLLSH
jgi:hypothetical protein